MEPVTVALVLGALIALIGALAGTAGFAAVVVRRQNRRLAALIEHLAHAQDEAALVAVDAARIRDPQFAARSAPSRTASPTPGGWPRWIP